ncbi:hypothetical protein ISF_08646 [Cordyceps fumosorosea ARSEF 2679]|uniref:Uncharacterized protein n=1 Tax=Cordyceps fumosorosea (strain ARSEF 2679) TaxID=1081104 RepID=A0A167LYZ0_CORFA|nr:hypothetical protein ISF_08646 [Cordyceps fumosorosea ARSEF 2679]OAA53707.1 hypothetical protein ISF_08646 [Cordyceps fumosorosea ARSEF 2679]
MCTTTVYVHADGRRSAGTQPVLCHLSRFGRPCSALIEVEQSMSRDRIPPAAPAAPIHSGTHSPRPSSHESTGNRYSISSRHSNSSRQSTDDHHSTGSRHSSTSSSRRSARDRSPGIYINGQRVNVQSSSGRERIVVVPNPPTPRTPPQNHAVPRTAPSSPANNLAVPHTSSSPRESYNRPYLVDERTPRYFQVPPSPTASNSSRHSRQTSTSSQGSTRYSYTSVSSAAAASAAEEEAERERTREKRREARKDQEMKERIQKANAEIANRQSYGRAGEQRAPQQQQVASERRSRRDDFDEPLAGAMGRLSVEDRNWQERRAHQRALQLAQQEQEEQDRRLRERMVPSRRATVGPASRRPRVDYEHGVYRYE